MDSYFKDPEATEATIRDGWLYTGDMAVIDEQGYILIKIAQGHHHPGRREHLLVEVENALLAHPAVLECAVVAAPDKALGEARSRWSCSKRARP